MNRILITGASGMTGAALSLRLASEGNEVVVFSRGSLPFYHNQPNITWVSGDVQNRDLLFKSMAGVDQVFHLAAIATHWAPDLRSFYRTNVQGSLNVLDAAQAAGVSRVVITTSAGVIGPPDPDHVIPVDESHVRTVRFFNDYEASKAMVHERVHEYVRSGLDVVLVLPTRIWGPGPIDAKNSITFLFDRFLKEKWVTVPGTGSEIGNFIHVDDAVEGHILAMRHGKAGEKYILGGQNLTMDEITAFFGTYKGRQARVLRIPFRVIGVLATIESVLSGLFDRHPISTHSTLRRLAYHCPVSIEKAQRELGFEPMPFLEALACTESWLVNDGGEFPVMPNRSMQTKAQNAPLGNFKITH